MDRAETGYWQNAGTNVEFRRKAVLDQAFPDQIEPVWRAPAGSCRFPFPARADPTMTSSPEKNRVRIAWVVATAFLMEQLDATIITTAIPAMAQSLHSTAVQLSLAVSAYIFTLAVFIPLSGWLADRFGARRIFMAALAIFTFGSALCGLADSLGMLVICRILQGLGGAMMTPVGRLILLGSFPRGQLIRAMTYTTLPATLGPVMGPLLGGYLTSYLSWRWIFYINLPFGLAGILLAYRFAPSVVSAVPRFDRMGFLLFAIGVGLLQFSMEVAGHLSMMTLLLLVALGGLLLIVYAGWSRKHAYPAVDLGLLRGRAFGVATLAGGVCRVAMNSPVYLLPLLLQLGLGLSPAISGSLTFLSAVASPAIRLIIGPGIRRLGFRAILTGSAMACSLALAGFAGIGPGAGSLPVAGLIIFFGVVRASQFMTSNTLAYADIPAERLSRATSLGGVLQQLTVSFGVSLGAALLEFLAPRQLVPSLATFHMAFLILACLPLLVLPAFLLLRSEDGAAVRGHTKS